MTDILYRPWKLLVSGEYTDILGYLPGLLLPHDKRPVRAQLETNYGFGGGFNPFEGFTDPGDGKLHYPGDPPMKPLATCEFPLSNERVTLYQGSWLRIDDLAKPGTFVVTRVD